MCVHLSPSCHQLTRADSFMFPICKARVILPHPRNARRPGRNVQRAQHTLSDRLSGRWRGSLTRLLDPSKAIGTVDMHRGPTASASACGHFWVLRWSTGPKGARTGGHATRRAPRP